MCFRVVSSKGVSGSVVEVGTERWSWSGYELGVYVPMRSLCCRAYVKVTIGTLSVDSRARWTKGHGNDE